MSIDGVFRTRSLGVPATGIPDQYADGKAAKVWQHYIGGHKNRTESYREFFCNLLRERGIENVLDVACGTGVDSIMLLENGFHITSVDASDKMLKTALRIRWNRRKETPFDNWVVEEGNWLNLEDADIEPPEGGFDGIICLGNSFAHLPDFSGELANQKIALNNFMNFLKPGGWLIIDHRNYDAIIDSGKAPQKNLYYNSNCIEDIKTSVLYVDGKATMITLDYTVDASKSTEPIMEDQEPSPKRKRTVETQPSKFRLSYCPHRLSNFTQLLADVFGQGAEHIVFADFKPLGEVETPAYYVHMIQRPLVAAGNANGDVIGQ